MRSISFGMLVAIFAAHGQANEAAATFEVVSIKLSAGPAAPKIDPGYLHFPMASLKFLIMRAYDVRFDQIDGPSWLAEPPYFDLNAKLPQGASKVQVPAMLRTVLAGRFKLKVHWEPRIDRVYALLTEKSGVKLKKANASTGSTTNFSSSGHYSLRATTMEQFARFLAGLAGRPVFDKTGVSGTFDIDLDAEPAPTSDFRQLSDAGASAASDKEPLPSVFSALRSLGLRLQPEKAEVRRLVVDSALKVPVEN